MSFRQWFQGLRLSLARLPVGGTPSEGPVHAYRDPWKGDPEQGARLIGGRFRFDRQDYRLPHGDWERGPWPAPAREWLHGFSWLRDLRALGSDEARLTARALVQDWLSHPPTDPLIRNACVTGSRLASWLSNHEFCLASADRQLQHRLMERMLLEGRTIAALLPLPPQGWCGLTALRGLLAAAMAMPEHTGFMSRYLRYLPAELDRLILSDGMVAERSPEAQFRVARELAEMSVMFRTAHASVPPDIETALDKVCPVLRAFCHGDGALAVFNGANERSADEVDDVLALGARQKLIAPAMARGKFSRLGLGKSLLIVDSGRPAAAGFDRTAHAGTLSFEFSHHRHRLFVNCGSAMTGPWEEAMRSSAAHTVLVAGGLSSTDFGPDGHVTRRPPHVTAEHQTNGEAHWLSLSHDGYHAPLGVKWTRHLYLGDEGEDFRGQEILEGEREVDFAIRFHVHPDVWVLPDDEDIILRAGGLIWRFRQRGGAMRLEDDVYLGRGQREVTKQIVITPLHVQPAPVEETSVEKTGEAGNNDAAGQAAPEAAAEQSGKAADAPKAETAGEAPATTSVTRKATPRKVRKLTHQTVTWLLERIPE